MDQTIQAASAGGRQSSRSPALVHPDECLAGADRISYTAATPSAQRRSALQENHVLVVDDEELYRRAIERILRREVNSMTERHTKSASILRRAAEVSPAMGLIGTLVGLVQMLGRLDDPSTIGPSMAVALLTTFYGAILANMVFSPMAAKLERNSNEESLVNTIFLTAAASMGRQENPRRLEMLLNTILPPAHRLQYYTE